MRRQFMVEAVAFLLAIAGSAAFAGGGAPSFTARSYFMEARRLYRAAEYAAGTNSVIHKYSREDPFGFDGRYDLPDMQRKRIPDEPIFWKVPGLRNVRDIGGWTGLNTGVVYRGSQLYRVDGAPGGVSDETRRIVKEEWKLATDFDLRGMKAWATGKGASTNLAELTDTDVRKISHGVSAYERIFGKPQVIGAALKDLAKPETYPTYRREGVVQAPQGQIQVISRRDATGAGRERLPHDVRADEGRDLVNTADSRAGN